MAAGSHAELAQGSHEHPARFCYMYASPLVRKQGSKVVPIAKPLNLKAEQTSIDGDQFSLEILFDNLIKNANKYSGENTQIVITVIEHETLVQVLIEDSGIGISPEIMPSTFQRFFRVKQHTQTGSGLGLSIVKNIVALHEGSVDLSTSQLGGLQVDIKLPKASEKSGHYVYAGG